MTFRSFFSKAAEKGIISQFQELNLSPDIIIEYCGKQKKMMTILSCMKYETNILMTGF